MRYLAKLLTCFILLLEYSHSRMTIKMDLYIKSHISKTF